MGIPVRTSRLAVLCCLNKGGGGVVVYLCTCGWVVRCMPGPPYSRRKFPRYSLHYRLGLHALEQWSVSCPYANRTTLSGRLFHSLVIVFTTSPFWLEPFAVEFHPVLVLKCLWQVCVYWLQVQGGQLRCCADLRTPGVCDLLCIPTISCAL
jgi:hypothetical protein